jgi:putative membrane protein
MTRIQPAYLRYLSAALLVMLSTGIYAQKQTKLTDPEIASVAVTANQIDIDFAQIAIEKSKNTEILNFAKTIANDHKAVIDQAVALVTRLKVSPQANDLSKKLLSDAEKTKAMLKRTKASNFDKVYIDNEVAYHKAVIGAVETVLVPQSANAELKGLLEKVLPALRTHLAHAEMVQQKLPK